MAGRNMVQQRELADDTPVVLSCSLLRPRLHILQVWRSAERHIADRKCHRPGRAAECLRARGHTRRVCRLGGMQECRMVPGERQHVDAGRCRA